jgi:hypothetical protein
MDQSQARTDGGMPFNTRLFERMRAMHHAWLKNAQELRQLELDYGAKLMSARTAPEAASFCNEWMVKRMVVVLREQEMFANSWVWLLADVAVSLLPASAPRPAGDSAGLARP